VIWGLLDNAVKYGGGTPITVTVELASGDGGTLRLRVADAGPGIAEADRGRLFERYARGSLPSADGTGLGLYVSRELARANGGELVLEQPEAGLGDPRAGDAAASAGSAHPAGATFHPHASRGIADGGVMTRGDDIRRVRVVVASAHAR